MNTPIASVLAITALGFVAHITGGLLESLSISPKKWAASNNNTELLQKADRSWVQALCAFQLVSVDLLVLCVVLYLLAFTSVLQPAREIGFAVAGIYFLWGAAWLLQLAALKRTAKDYLLLGHWSVWFLCAGLVYWGALSL